VLGKVVSQPGCLVTYLYNTTEISSSRKAVLSREIVCNSAQTISQCILTQFKINIPNTEIQHNMNYKPITLSSQKCKCS